MLLAVDDAETTRGIVGLRAIDETTGELRRLYVLPSHRSSGLGRQLIDRLIDDAAGAGIRRIVLSTLPSMNHALGLYRSIGFIEIDPYVAEPTAGVMYLAFDIGAEPSPNPR